MFFYLTVGLKIKILSKWLDQMDQYASVSKREMTISNVPEIFRLGEDWNVNQFKSSENPSSAYYYFNI